MSKALFLAVFVPALAVLAQVQPVEPAPGNVYNEGAACNIEWVRDATGQWTTMNIQLMTGPNNAMVHLTTVATVDGTKDTSFSYTCPSVSPNAAIYFYQFSTPAAPTNLTWTGRFAIADASGKTTEPTEEQDGIKFGTGALADPGSASPAPDYLGGAVIGTTPAAGGNSTGASTTVQTVISTSVTGALTATGSLTTSVRSSLSTANPANQASGSNTGSVAPSQTTSGASALVLDFKSRSMQALAGLVGTALIFGTIF